MKSKKRMMEKGAHKPDCIIESDFSLLQQPSTWEDELIHVNFCIVSTLILYSFYPLKAPFLITIN